jgi:hypothetical protein
MTQVVFFTIAFLFIASHIQTDQSAKDNAVTPVYDQIQAVTESMRLPVTPVPTLDNPLNSPAYTSSTNNAVTPAYDWLNKTLGRTDNNDTGN